MYLLQADYLKMSVLSEQLHEVSNGMQSCMDSLIKSVKRMELSWKGEANAAFLLQMQEDFFTMQVFINGLKSAADQLSEIIREYQKTEAIIEQKIGGIRI